MPACRQILHVDMDAFFASVEQRDDEALRGRPVLVGSRSRRGVVAAASYEARPFGVHSAMPMMAALQRCPEAIVVPPRLHRYGEVSAQVFAILRAFTPLVEGLSLDEAFLDVTGSVSLFGEGRAIAEQIKTRIVEETGLRASAGVAPCKFVAKIASDLHKPDALVEVKPDEVAAFLAPLPIERMWGVGAKTAPKLRAAGLHTLGDLAVRDTRAIEHLLGSWGIDAQALARGIDPRPVTPNRPAKSIGAEVTFEQDIADHTRLERHLLAQAARVAARLCRERLTARIVVVKLKYADFTVQSRRMAVSDPVADTDSIFELAKQLLARFGDRRAVRLTGVAVSGLCEAGAATALFPERNQERRRSLEALTARVHHKFGDHTLRRAALLVGDDD